MKQREPRRRVILPARMRLGARWIDVSIRNLSSRGMLVHSEEAVDRGTIVEIRRGQHIVIGRAMWREGRLFGLHAQDRIDLDGITARPDLVTARRPNGEPERRQRPRKAVDPGRAVRLGRHMQALGLGAAALVAAVTAAQTAHQTLSTALAGASQALVGEQHRIETPLER